MLHAVVAHYSPATRVVDLTHLVPRHDIRSGALTLWRSAPWLVPGVILAVVDPGVGTERRAVAIEVAAAGAVLVGPDNGLLLPAAVRLGGPSAAVELPPNPLAPGATFAGRDVFAPAAARAANGEPLGALGRPIDPATLAGQPVAGPQAEAEGRLRTEVLWVDRFGNAQLNATPDDVARLIGTVAEARTAEGAHPVRVVRSYGDIGDDEVALVVDSYGLLALSCNCRSAAGTVGVVPGDLVWLCRDRG